MTKKYQVNYQGCKLHGDILLLFYCELGTGIVRIRCYVNCTLWVAEQGQL